MLNLPAAFNAYFLILAAALGLVMGSFLNCFAYRYAKHETVTGGRSHCALCGHTLAPLELVPVFSWIFLRRKCRYCGGRISSRYILAELICAAMYVSVLLRFGVSIPALKYLIFVSLLFAAAAADIYCGLIPDRLIITGIAAALLFSLLPPNGGARALLDCLIGGFSVALPLLVLVLVFDRLMKRETMGGGDIKLIFMLGLFLGWEQSILLIILACATGLLIAVPLSMQQSGGEKREFPFAPALCVSAWIVMLAGREILGWYAGLFGL